MSPVAQAMELQAKLAGRFKHPSDIDTSGAVIHLPEESFTFVTVADHYRALQPLAAVQHPDDEKGQFDFIERLAPAYDKFVTGLYDVIRECGQSSGRSSVVCSLDSAELTREVRRRVEGKFVVSLNEGDLWADFRLGLSRLFSLGGERFTTHTGRPGFSAVHRQLRALKEIVQQKRIEGVALVDDHAFSGKTIETVVGILQEQGIKVELVATGTRVNALASIEESGIHVDPVKRFMGDTRPTKIDLVESRYFLFGAAGCVVELPDGSLARAPYVLPLGSPHERASIPKEEAAPFSRRVIDLNQEFYRAFSEAIGRPALVSDLDSSFQRLAGFHGFRPDEPLQQLFSKCSARLEALTVKRLELEGQQHKMRPLRVSGKRVVFLDLDHTIIRPGASEVDPAQRENLIRRIEAVQRTGAEVGLNSDSPLGPLQDFASRYGMSGMVLAELGAVVGYRGQSVILRELERQGELLRRIHTVASSFQLQRGDDALAAVFGGTGPTIQPGTYRLGAGRKASISVFGSPSFIDALGEEFRGDQERYGIDVNPKATNGYGFFAIHSRPIAKGKGETLTMLARLGMRLVMIGDSLPDFVEPFEEEYGGSVSVGLVGNHSVPGHLAERCQFRTGLFHTAGVCELLDQCEAVLRLPS